MQQKTVLVVDDEDHILRVVSYKLRGAGYTVLEANDGEEAWEILRGQSVDLVLTDQQMPFMTGLELVETMRTRPETADVPVLMLTARGFRLDAEELQRGGRAHEGDRRGLARVRRPRRNIWRSVEIK